MTVSPSVLTLIRAIAGHIPQGDSAILLQQAQEATVIDEVPGRMLDVEVPPTTARLSLPDGPMDPAPALLDEHGNVAGELLLWITDGRLTGVERPWFTETAPDEWPHPSMLRFDS